MTRYLVDLVFDQDERYRLSVRPAHRAYLADLAAAGTLDSAGPLADGSGAVLVYDVVDRPALDAALAADPYFSGDQPAATVTAVREWGVLYLGPGPAATTPAEHPGAGGLSAPDRAAELEDLLDALQRHRGFLRQTLQGLTDAQAGERSTVSELCLGGLIKHVAATERGWLDFAVRGAEASVDDLDWGAVDWTNPSPEAQAAMAERTAEFSMVPGDTVESVLATYAEVATQTERTLRGLDLDASHELPAAPWFEPGARWTVRRVVLHVVAETAQHAGHADILREAIDGTKQMG